MRLARVRWLLLSREGQQKKIGVMWVHPGAALPYGRVLFAALSALRGKAWTVTVEALSPFNHSMMRWDLD